MERADRLANRTGIAGVVREQAVTIQDHIFSIVASLPNRSGRTVTVDRVGRGPVAPAWSAAP